MRTLLRRARRDDRGFTLIELLIVIVILGVLAGIVVFAVGDFTNRGKAAACQADLKNVETAVEAYKTKEGHYPADLNALKPDYLREVPTGETITFDATSGQITSDACAIPGTSLTATAGPTSTSGDDGGRPNAFSFKPLGAGDVTSTTVHLTWNAVQVPPAIHEYFIGIYDVVPSCGSGGSHMVGYAYPHPDAVDTTVEGLHPDTDYWACGAAYGASLGGEFGIMQFHTLS
jgi:general secretion pathway protein G